MDRQLDLPGRRAGRLGLVAATTFALLSFVALGGCATSGGAGTAMSTAGMLHATSTPVPTAAPTAAAPVGLSSMAGMHHAPADAEAAWAARPAFTGVDPETEAAYEYALFHPEAIAWMPCYCGCAAIDHRSNLDCYLARETANGKTQFEEHASFCEICVRTTLLTQRLLGEGRSLREIRSVVDTTFGGAVPGTPTELPPG